MPRQAPATAQFSLDGQTLWKGVRQVSACTEEPILSIAHGHNLTLVVFREARLVISWHFSLTPALETSVVFGIPPMIASHLCKSDPPVSPLARMSVHGGDVSLCARDADGPFELRWRFEMGQFPAPPELNRLLLPPTEAVAVDHLEIADAILGAAARLMALEIERQLHRSKLAVLVGLPGDRVVVDGREVSKEPPGFYHFDPRLITRALDFMRSDRIEVGLTPLDLQRAFLSLVDRQPDHTLHCALLSLGLDTQRLIAPGRGIPSRRA
ncbi:MAG TPA: hypothetical protein VLC52_16700 [Anaerolineae bacterium]|nr:hypothetical protein [Anaerolineae bacterium]